MKVKMKEKVLLLAVVVSLFMFGCGKTEEIIVSSGSVPEEEVVEEIAEEAVEEVVEEAEEVEEEQMGEQKCVRVTLNGNTVRTYEYDSNGNLVKEVEYDYDGTTINSEREYDTNGNLIKEVNYTGVINTYSIFWNITDPYEYEYEYDTNGNLIKVVQRDSNGMIIREREYEYDVNGNVIKEVRYYEGEFDSWYEYEYDLHYSQVSGHNL